MVIWKLPSHNCLAAATHLKHLHLGRPWRLRGKCDGRFDLNGVAVFAPSSFVLCPDSQAVGLPLRNVLNRKLRLQDHGVHHLAPPRHIVHLRAVRAWRQRELNFVALNRTAVTFRRLPQGSDRGCCHLGHVQIRRVRDSQPIHWYHLLLHRGFAQVGVGVLCTDIHFVGLSICAQADCLPELMERGRVVSAARVRCPLVRHRRVGQPVSSRLPAHITPLRSARLCWADPVVRWQEGRRIHGDEGRHHSGPPEHHEQWQLEVRCEPQQHVGLPEQVQPHHVIKWALSWFAPQHMHSDVEREQVAMFPKQILDLRLISDEVNNLRVVFGLKLVQSSWQPVHVAGFPRNCLSLPYLCGTLLSPAPALADA
mmetsp:Transcript_23704/g.65776  ORF Transcript_23704/g.65776 Transcript_23704/m.65776 type:complete len:367 (-) Transcript_23704:420-1520(-)